MMRSLFSGVSGLKNHQVRMDVIGNNIANVNTVAFKAGRVTFKEGFTQLLQGANRPSEGQGGTNAKQVGMGMQVGSIDTIFSQGNLEATGLTTDLAIQGEGFFVVARGNQNFFTRAGNFQLDAEGRLVNGTNGYRLQGRTAVDGVLGQRLGDINIPLGQQAQAVATTNAILGGNLNSGAEAGTEVETSISVYDSLGNRHELMVTFTKSATSGEWSWAVNPDSLGLTPGDVTGGSGTVTFDANGVLTAPTTDPTVGFTPVGGGSPMSVTIDFGGGRPAGLTQSAGSSSAVFREQNGWMAGTLQNFTIDRSGAIMGSFSNGTSQILGQIAIAEFSNPGGLLRTGDNLYTTSPNSGDPAIGFASEDSRSSIASGSLEMSNVDLTQEFTNMIVAQRGFQANGRIITTTDEMLQEVVNLKR